MKASDLKSKIAMLAVIGLCLSLAGAITAFAQVSGATLAGAVTDSSGAVIPNAQLTIKNVATGVTRSVTSNGNGFYSAPNLLPGAYQVQVSARGFKTILQKGITLTVGAEETLNLSLQVGGASQTVVVTSAPQSVQSSSSTISATVDATTVRELPLNGRDWTSLATLEPGVVNIPNQATTSFSANKGNRGFGNQLSNGGHRANENNYRVNGISINDYSNAAPGGATGVNLGVDAIEEFSVLTSTYTAEYGRTSGAVINAITKSGTNQFHGTGYFFDRDSIFDARNYFDGPTIPLSGAFSLGRPGERPSSRTRPSSLATMKAYGRASLLRAQFKYRMPRNEPSPYLQLHPILLYGRSLRPAPRIYTAYSPSTFRCPTGQPKITLSPG